MPYKKIILSLILVFIINLAVIAQDSFDLQIPVKATLNKDCWIMNYVDDDKSDNWHDYRGGRQTYKGHSGTDFGISSYDMEKGIDVVAAASGIVVAIRDGVPDKNALSQDLQQLQKVGAGNRVAIKHSDGWITDYCHIKKGSVQVKVGDYVCAGQKLGEIGMSGLTEFPHLHFSVQKGTQFFDPFTGLEIYKNGNKAPLWKSNDLAKLGYSLHIIYSLGVSNEIPSLINIRNGKYESNRLPANSNMILFWVDTMHVEANDIIRVIIKNPKNKEFLNQKIVVDKSNAKKCFYMGRKKPVGGFQKGNYQVQVFFKRYNADIDRIINFNFSVD